MIPKLYIGECPNGWFARIDGQCLFDSPTIRDNPHTKPRKSFPVAEGLDNKHEAELAAHKWMSLQIKNLETGR